MARARDVQADFAQLQREYRNMEQNRKAYTEESQNIIRRQQKSIDKLRKENESLKSELAMETRHANARRLQSAPPPSNGTLAIPVYHIRVS